MASKQIDARSSTALTTAQLVTTLRNLARDPALLNERLKHWARMNLLTPAGTQYPGTGVHRLYGAGAIVRAATSQHAC